MIMKVLWNVITIKKKKKKSKIKFILKILKVILISKRKYYWKESNSLKKEKEMLCLTPVQSLFNPKKKRFLINKEIRLNSL